MANRPIPVDAPQWGKALKHAMGFDRGPVAPALKIRPGMLDIYEESGLDVRPDYRGRGMDHGCVGFVSEEFWDIAQVLMSVGATAEECEDVELQELCRYLLTHKPSHDTMALKRIYYWEELTTH